MLLCKHYGLHHKRFYTLAQKEVKGKPVGAPPRVLIVIQLTIKFAAPCARVHLFDPIMQTHMHEHWRAHSHLIPRKVLCVRWCTLHLCAKAGLKAARTHIAV